VHWPFCQAKCPYCDFNSHVRAQVDQERWRRALISEIADTAARAPTTRVESVFFGGGTPSLMPPETVAAVLEAIDRYWPGAGECEITLEANPGSVEAGRFAGYRSAGVNRVSLGVQSLEDAALAFLGRLHSAEEAKHALAIAKARFERVSFDVIYARPGQSLEAWRDELTRALDLAGGHLSAYQLTIEADTAFARRYARGDFRLPEGEAAAELFELTQEMTQSAGLPAYEISNHARPGEECRHNRLIWQAGGYAGIGPGAHGRLPTGDGGAVATARLASPEAWLESVEARGHGTAETEIVPAETRAEEAVMLGLRLIEGLDKARFSSRIGRSLESVVDGEAAAQLVAGGHLEDSGDRLRATAQGRAVLDSVIAALLA